jgi:hypothetical protein
VRRRAPTKAENLKSPNEDIETVSPFTCRSTVTVRTGRAWEIGGTGLSQPVTVAAIKAARNPTLEYWCCLSKEAKAYESERLRPELAFQALHFTA